MKYIATTHCTATELSHEQRIVSEKYPFRVSPYYASLIRSAGDAVWRQCIPDVRELEDDGLVDDPLSEHALSPVPGLIHRYPDRVVLLVSNRCPVYCRFCMRKRHVGGDILSEPVVNLDQAAAYIASRPEICDVVLSGGDPLMLDDDSLQLILLRLREIGHVRFIRIGTRVPVTLPERITPELCSMLRRFHPLFINTHFNHPQEITPDSARACASLADAGIPLGNQTVLLRGVNDTETVMRDLLTGLLSIRVKPYYLHQMDVIRGGGHFRTPVTTGLDIIRSLRGHVSGMAIPHFVIDLPEGKGKVPLLPDPVVRDGDVFYLTTYRGEVVAYHDIVTLTGADEPVQSGHGITAVPV